MVGGITRKAPESPLRQEGSGCEAYATAESSTNELVTASMGSPTAGWPSRRSYST